VNPIYVILNQKGEGIARTEDKQFQCVVGQYLVPRDTYIKYHMNSLTMVKSKPKLHEAVSVC